MRDVHVSSEAGGEQHVLGGQFIRSAASLPNAVVCRVPLVVAAKRANCFPQNFMERLQRRMQISAWHRWNYFSVCVCVCVAGRWRRLLSVWRCPQCMLCSPRTGEGGGAGTVNGLSSFP